MYSPSYGKNQQHTAFEMKNTPIIDEYEKKNVNNYM